MYSLYVYRGMFVLGQQWSVDGRRPVSEVSGMSLLIRLSHALAVVGNRTHLIRRLVTIGFFAINKNKWRLFLVATLASLGLVNG